MKQQLQRHFTPGIDSGQYTDIQILKHIILSLKVEDLRNLINGLQGKDGLALVAVLKIHPKLIYVISGACRLRESEPFEMFTVDNWYFIYKSRELLFANNSYEIIERIFRQCTYYEELEFREQERTNTPLILK